MCLPLKPFKLEREWTHALKHNQAILAAKAAVVMGLMEQTADGYRCL
jgi:hypothetical protein